MATGRTVVKWANVFVDGYDMTGYSRTFGPLTWMVEEADSTTLGEVVKTAMAGPASINIGTLNTVLDNTSIASHALLNAQAVRKIMLPLGIRAAPAQGDPAFVGVLGQNSFYSELSNDTTVNISAGFSGWSTEAVSLLYGNPWASLLAAKVARTAVNSSGGVDDYGGVSTTRGGYMMYQLFSSNGTVTLKTQDSADNSAFADLVTSASLNASVTPAADITVLGATATVRRYLRWQLVFGTATTATFALAFVRNK